MRGGAGVRGNWGRVRGGERGLEGCAGIRGVRGD